MINNFNANICSNKMGLSRLENFLKNIKGEVLYVDPSSLDSTDAIDNQATVARPFKTIQRALIEASDFYQVGLDNDRFGKTLLWSTLESTL